MLLAAIGWQLRTVWSAALWLDMGRQLLAGDRLGWLLLTLLLMPLNWALEAVKWRMLLRPFHHWPLTRLLRALLAGISISLLTPNRIGEYGGRALLAPPGQTGAVVLSSLLGSLCQWAAFLLLGWPALVLTAGRTGLLTLEPAATALLCLAGPLLIGGLFTLLPRLKPDRLRWPFRRGRTTVNQLLTALAAVKVGLIWRATASAGLRFCVYCMQLYCLLLAFGLSIPLLWGLLGVAAIFLLQAGLPLPPGVALLTRTELALLLWGGGAAAQSAAILAATTALFAINLLLPALAGTWYLIKSDEPQYTCYDKETVPVAAPARGADRSDGSQPAGKQPAALRTVPDGQQHLSGRRGDRL